ncbi:Cysteine proteinases superfamily protein [Raphanus sativus]|uniref:Uncharacterized protein LOC108829754 n=1 Tax=Raphanus sativus TaxID=3726 RepID=A0A6J0LFL5_RAPSA|nr:uncharacterized protein LOC108829754 [Raphanus sativus]KAJ4871743.1 Cysteine proteinases superfamily protein [Raphanus sativus]
MDSDSGDVDGVGCGGAGGSIGAGGIGAGGSGNKKGLNAYKHVAADKRKERLPPQDDLPPPPLRVFADGSRLLFDWRQIHPALLCHVICQMTDICWALVLGGILQFVFNKDRDISQHKEFDVDGFAKKVKCGDKGSEPVKTVGASSMAIGSMRVAMNYVLNVGMEKVKDTMKGKAKAKAQAQAKTFKLRGSFLPVTGATPQTIIELMEAKGPVGLTLDLTGPLLELRDGVYRVPEPVDGAERHVVTILAHGLTARGEVFFEVQNTWGTDWGVHGYGRIIIPGTTNDAFYLNEIFYKKKK